MNVRYSTEDFCSICLQPYHRSTGHNAVELKCEHAFGGKCIKKWTPKRPTCPVCRSGNTLAELSEERNISRSLADRIIDITDQERAPPSHGFFLGFSACTSFGIVLKVLYDANCGPAIAVVATIPGNFLTKKGNKKRTPTFSS